MSSQPQPAREPRKSIGVTLLGFGSLALAIAESICVAAVGLSGIRVAIGLTSLVSAAVGGPAHGFHRNALRIPLLTASGIASGLVLLLVWNESRMRKSPAAAWRIQPLTPQQVRSRRLQVVLASLSLVLIALELLTHPLFHHEL